MKFEIEKLEALKCECPKCKNIDVCDRDDLFCVPLIEALFNDQKVFDVPNPKKAR